LVNVKGKFLKILLLITPRKRFVNVKGDFPKIPFSKYLALALYQL